MNANNNPENSILMNQWRQRPLPDRLEIAEQYIRQNTGLYRHYMLVEVQRHVKRSTGVDLTTEEARTIVQRIRDGFEMGPIAEYNL